MEKDANNSKKKKKERKGDDERQKSEKIWKIRFIIHYENITNISPMLNR